MALEFDDGQDLIGVSFLQGGRARGAFRNIELVDGDQVVPIG